MLKHTETLLTLVSHALILLAGVVNLIVALTNRRKLVDVHRSINNGLKPRGQ